MVKIQTEGQLLLPANDDRPVSGVIDFNNSITSPSRRAAIYIPDLSEINRAPYYCPKVV